MNASHTKYYLPDFSDTKTAFASLTKPELYKAYYIFKALQNKNLVKIGSAFTKVLLNLNLPVKNIIKNTIYTQFCGGEHIVEALHTSGELHQFKVKTVLDYAAEGGNSEYSFNNVTRQILDNISLAEVHPEISCISLKVTGIGRKHLLEKINIGWQLSAEEEKEYQKIEERIDLICKSAQRANVIIYIDAEESWLQNPIDALAEKMMRRYNKTKPIIFNTLQMYRVDRFAYCKYLIDDARENNYISGIKIVRGAYHEKEALRAQQINYNNPVFSTKEGSDSSFNSAINLCLDNLDTCALCVASHNEYSIQYLIEEFGKRNLHLFANRILFSQLYGMSDNLTFNLAKAGWHASKYLPYGDVKTTMPYLIRRAEENTSIAGQMGRELSLIKQEIQRRKLERV